MADKSDLNINSNDKVVVKSVDMADEQQEVAIQLAQTSLAKFTTEKDVAANIKKEFDRKYLPNWHCIVGRSFGSYVTHETRQFIYFYVNDTAILLFKTS